MLIQQLLWIHLWQTWKSISKHWPDMICWLSFQMQKYSLLDKITARWLICTRSWSGWKRGIDDCKETVNSNFHVSRCRVGYACLSIHVSKVEWYYYLWGEQGKENHAKRNDPPVWFSYKCCWDQPNFETIGLVVK